MKKISVIGLGYVGLPLALMLSKTYKVIGFDISNHRVNSLNNHIDFNRQFSKKNLSSYTNISYTSNDNFLKNSSFFIITVPTPLKKNKPDLSLLKKATETVSKYLKKNSIVIYESTVFPGVTEEYCGKILSKKSKLIYKKDFFLAYSPERINPGDKKRTIEKITKIIGASDNSTLQKVKKVYSSFLGKNYYLVKSIKVAEAAKVIENSQRDINIAFMNEIKNIFDKAQLDTNEIIQAAKTKWNFLNFEPGLVGGHCIGVDPYYLAQFANNNGIKPKVILAGRDTNEKQVLIISKKIIAHSIKHKDSKILIMGCTFKENCPDIRNSKVIDIINKLKKKSLNIDVYDPWVEKNDKDYLNINFIDTIENLEKYSVIFVAVKHDIFKKYYTRSLKKLVKSKETLVIDYKNILK